MQKERFQNLWIGNKLGLIEQLSIKSILHHGYEFDLYTYEEIEGVPDGVNLCDAEAVIPHELLEEGDGRKPINRAHFADFFRYKLLYEKGGVWSDVDSILLRPIDENTEYIFGYQEKFEGGPFVNNGFIKVPPKTDLMKECYEQSLAKNATQTFWGELGPFLLTKMIEEHQLQSYVTPPIAYYPINWWEYTDFIDPKLSTEIQQKILHESTAVHLWRSQWSSRKIENLKRTWRQPRRLLLSLQADPDKRYPNTTLLGKLQDMYL